ncbi:hypothetical protein INR49_027361 [Caranx melampygus]|nr:hypothetical protein INR49_027361 [Caranx melampygus]
MVPRIGRQQERSVGFKVATNETYSNSDLSLIVLFFFFFLNAHYHTLSDADRDHRCLYDAIDQGKLREILLDQPE